MVMLKLVARHHRFGSGLLVGVLIGLTLSSLSLLWDRAQDIYIRDTDAEAPPGVRHRASDIFSHTGEDTYVADALYDSVRVMCLVTTTQDRLRKKADHVMATWGRRCNDILFISDGNDTELPVINFNIRTGRSHLTAKTMNAFDFCFRHHLAAFDWFLKADEDTYVVLENLRYFLSAQNTSEPAYFGHHFDMFVGQGYMSGGAGYVINRETLKRFGQRPAGLCAKDWGDEDVMFGECMEDLGVRPGDSRDSLGRSRFHCFHPQTFILGDFPAWYQKNNKYGALKGLNAMSDYVISFHYLPPKMLYVLDFLIYHVHVHGIKRKDQQLNGPVNLTYIRQVSLSPFPAHIEIATHKPTTKSASGWQTKVLPPDGQNNHPQKTV